MTNTTSQINSINKAGTNNQHHDFLWLATGLIPPLGLVISWWLWFNRSLKKAAFLVLLVSIMSLASYLVIYYQHYKNQSLRYHYISLQLAGATSGAPNTTLSFKKPVEFTTINNNSSYLINYQHKLKRRDTNVLVGLSAASSIHINGPAVLGYPSIVADALKGQVSSPEYQTVIENLLSFATSQLPKAFDNVNLSNAQSLDNTNIKNYAWQFDLTANDPGSKKAPKWQGKVVYLWGKNGAYYFIVATVKQNWVSNQQIWQQVFDSIKIDQ